MCEVEAIINNRPLTAVSKDLDNLTPLTSNHLLFIKTTCPLPPGTFDTEEKYSRKRWKQVQFLANLFWSRWRREYLPALQTRQKWTRTHRKLLINDIVLVMDRNLPRNVWLLGRILETYPDTFGHVRTARVLTKHSISIRPITKLVLLTLASDCTSS